MLVQRANDHLDSSSAVMTCMLSVHDGWVMVDRVTYVQTIPPPPLCARARGGERQDLRLHALVV